jgi:uncharacterized protein YndB with AHSA1/START domain
MASGRSERHSTAATLSSSADLTISRVFDAPATHVWRAWTEPEYLMQWWGPRMFTSPACTIDLRVGGKYLFCMRSPDNQDFWSTGFYRTIVPLARIVCTDSFADADGNVVPATYYGMSDDLPLEMEIAITFQEHAGRTTMTLTHSGIPKGQMMELTREGWIESFDKLAESL